VQIIPGSHKKIVPHVPSRDGMAFGEEANPAHVDTSNVVNMELAPGEFFLFNERLLHHSDANRSDKRRIGLTMRVTVPFVKVVQDKPPLFPGHKVMVVRGEDNMGFNDVAPPPPGD
jgi:ectoine hydroxylase-related dioxygenase (phytanoyl-CoA dioxygenase family)